MKDPLVSPDQILELFLGLKYIDYPSDEKGSDDANCGQVNSRPLPLEELWIHFLKASSQQNEDHTVADKESC